MEDTLQILLVDANLIINVKQQTYLKTKFAVKIGGVAVTQCLYTTRH